MATIQLDYYEFPSIKHNGTDVYGYATVEIDYDTDLDSCDYPLASHGSKVIKTNTPTEIRMSIHVVDNRGEVLFDDDADSGYNAVPHSLYKQYEAIIHDDADDLIRRFA